MKQTPTLLLHACTSNTQQNQQQVAAAVAAAKEAAAAVAAAVAKEKVAAGVAAVAAAAKEAAAAAAAAAAVAKEEAAAAAEVIPDSIVEFLLESSVKDFRMTQQPLPEAFRNLSFGYLEGENQIRRFLMCKEFSYQNESGDVVWRHFATIQTSDYEQWVGNKQSDYCRDATPLSYSGDDLPAELLKRLQQSENEM
jgi:hypothetical protein